MAAKPFAPGFLTDVTESNEDINLRGVKCQDCKITLFGERSYCENCSSQNLSSMVFSRTGRLHSYTVQRHSPSEPYKLGSTETEDWEPRAIGYVDLPEDVRLLSIIDADPETLKIGMSVTLTVETGWTDDDGNPVLSYTFTPEAGQ